MEKITFRLYKKEIIERYKAAQKEDVSGILLTPTPAQMRQLCIIKIDNGLSVADEDLMKLFFETKPNESLKRSVEHCNIDRFRPVISFLKSEKDTDHSTRVELAAILVDFKPRPYAQFLTHGTTISKTAKKEETNSEENTPEDPGKQPRKRLYKRGVYLGLILMGAFCLSYVVKDFVAPEKQCMQWQNDHYEMVNCTDEINSLYTAAPIVPVDKGALGLNKVCVCDTTTFFRGGKAIIWYCKNDTIPEFFDDLGTGYHPITGKPLRPVTDYIIKKYVAKN